MNSDLRKYIKDHIQDCSDCVFRGECYPDNCAALDYWADSWYAMDYIV